MAARIVPEGGWENRLKPARTPRVKNRPHLDFIKGLFCVCCAVDRGDLAVRADDPMHIRSGSLQHGKEPTGAGQTSDDRWTLPGCRGHHDRQHDYGNEMAFWTDYGIDPHLLALILWGLSGDEHAANKVILLHARSARYRVTIEGARRAAGR